MTSRRWDNVPKRRVERPALLTPGSKAGSRKQSSFRDRVEEAGKTRTEREGPSRTASAVASATVANGKYDRCSVCKAQGVTLWRVNGPLMCGICRTANRVANSQPGHLQEQDLPKAVRSKRTAAVAIAGKDIMWAAAQGANDRDAGTVCPKYKKFLYKYTLPKSPFTLQLWDAYRLARQAAPQDTARSGSKCGPSTPPHALQSQTPGAADSRSRKRARRARRDLAMRRPKQKKYWTGLSVHDASTSRRKTMRRYDLVEPRRSDLSPENAALLMQVNQQNTLVDMWR
jgi:hypothetical protein